MGVGVWDLLSEKFYETLLNKGKFQFSIILAEKREESLPGALSLEKFLKRRLVIPISKRAVRSSEVDR